MLTRTLLTTSAIVALACGVGLAGDPPKAGALAADPAPAAAPAKAAAGVIKGRVSFEGEADPIYETISAADTDPVHRFTYAEDRPPIAEVWIDPPPGPDAVEFDGGAAGVYLLDSNLINNAWRRETDAEPALYRALRLLLEVQSELSFAGLIG